MEKPESRIEDVIKNEELTSLTKDLSEVAIDGILKEGVLKDIPIVGTIVGVFKFGSTVNQYFFTKKLNDFIFQISEVSQEQRFMKINEINSSGKYRTKVGEAVLEIIDKIESEYKPEIIGRLFKAVLQEIIDYQDYLRLTSIVNKIFLDDLTWLKNQYQDGNFDKQIEINTGSPLLTSSLLIDDMLNANSICPDKNNEGTVANRKPSSIGRILLEIGMNNL